MQGNANVRVHNIRINRGAICLFVIMTFVPILLICIPSTSVVYQPGKCSNFTYVLHSDWCTEMTVDFVPFEIYETSLDSSPQHTLYTYNTCVIGTLNSKCWLAGTKVHLEQRAPAAENSNVIVFELALSTISAAACAHSMTSQYAVSGRYF